MKQKSLISDFTKGNITKQLIVFSTPLFLSSLLQVVYNMVDMIIVGNQLGKVGLSAVAVGGDVSNFLTFISMGFANAGQVIISQYIGAGKRDKIGKFISTMFTFLMGCAVVISGVCLIFREPILRVMNTPDEAFEQAIAYSTICMAGSVFIYGYNIMSAVLRGLGDAKHPFVFICIAAVLNILLDILFVMGMDMGAGGAALATVISQAVSFFSCCGFLYAKRQNLGFEIQAKDFKTLDKAMLMSLIKLGVPMAIKSASVHISKLFVNSYINSYGVAVSAFAGIAAKVNSIAILFSNSLNTAGSSMVGQNIAAGQYKRVSKILGRIFVITLGIATVMSVLVYTFPMKIFGLFTDDQQVLKIALEYVPIAIVVFYAAALRSGMNGLINGSGNYKVNFATAIFDGIIMRIGLSLLFGVAIGMGYIGFWLGDACAGFTPFFVGVVFYFTGQWKKKEGTSIT